MKYYILAPMNMNPQQYKAVRVWKETVNLCIQERVENRYKSTH